MGNIAHFSGLRQCVIMMMFMAQKNFSNEFIASLLRSVAAAYTVEDENKFKFQIVAYERAADSVEHASSEIKDLWDEGKLSGLAGIGPAIASHLGELFQTGIVKHFNQLFSKLPAGMFPLLKIPGIGPKTAYKLTKTLKLNHPPTAIKNLKDAGVKGKIREIDGFGIESEAKILKGIEEYQGRSQRILLYQAEEISSEIVKYLKTNPRVVFANPLGSLRRKCSTVGDIDISVASDFPGEIINYFTNYPEKERILEAGQTTASLLLKNGKQVDLMVQPPDSYGSLLQHFTGSKHHNIKLREISLRKGYSLSEYGIRKLKKKEKFSQGTEMNVHPKGKLIKFSSEERFYRFLDLDLIPPELREDTGEIEAALRRSTGKPGGLPELIELSDIKGDFHLHTNFPIEPSHDLGENSAEEMISKALALKYDYLAFTEHNPSLSQHSESQIVDLLQKRKNWLKRIQKLLAEKSVMRIFNSLEVDIRPDGSLAVPEKGMESLDFIIVSIHSSFDQDKESMTGRILKALSCPKAKILGHPTGRILNQREGYEADWEKIFDYCIKNQKVLEISAFPRRLDLPDFLVREAVKKGVKIIISTDAHRAREMDLMTYGVSVARRGWAQKRDVVNTFPLKEISDILLC